jgi:hypothetical protein
MLNHGVFGTMTNKKVILGTLKGRESLGLGVLEYWSNGALLKGLTSFFQHSNTPSLQYSKAPKL